VCGPANEGGVLGDLAGAGMTLDFIVVARFVRTSYGARVRRQFTWATGKRVIHMSVEVQGRHLLANGIRLHFLEHAGDGPALILLPGITSPAITWAFVSARLAEFAHVYTLDNRGRGLSSGGRDLEYWLADYAADTAGFIAALGLARPIVLGHSMGARIAVKLAADYPDKVGRLILVDPPVSGPGRRQYPIPLQFYFDGLAAAERGDPIDKSNPVLGHWTDAQLLLRREWLPTCDRKAIEQSHRSFQEEDVHVLLPRVRSKALLLYAEKGGTVTEADAAEIANALPDARRQRIDGVGHMIPWDDLDAFVAAVRAFVAAS
jgi:N-formylmaleamate deformylase